MMMIAKNLARIQDQIASACSNVNRDPGDIILLAISKRKPPSLILEAIEAGVQHFGENRVEEAKGKIPEVHRQTNKTLHWHFVGHIQSRKARYITPQFHRVHSVDTLKLAEKLSRQLMEKRANERLDILLQMNISGEAAKGGFQARNWQQHPVILDPLLETVQKIIILPGLNVRGLMTMAPIVHNMEQTRSIFADLRALRDTLQENLNISLPELSMGMTDDFPVAIEEGATVIRIGRAIFGERNEHLEYG